MVFFSSPAAPLYVRPLASAGARRGTGFTLPAFITGLQNAAEMWQLSPCKLLGSGKFAEKLGRSGRPEAATRRAGEGAGGLRPSGTPEDVVGRGKSPRPSPPLSNSPCSKGTTPRRG